MKAEKEFKAPEEVSWPWLIKQVEAMKTSPYEEYHEPVPGTNLHATSGKTSDVQKYVKCFTNLIDSNYYKEPIQFGILKKHKNLMVFHMD